jgi:hypothetical protein
LSQAGTRFEVVVLNQKRAGAVPAADRLRILPRGDEIGKIAVFDRDIRSVQRDTPMGSRARIGMNVIPVEVDSGGKLAGARFPARSDRNQIGSLDTIGGLKLETLDLVMIGSRRNHENRISIRRIHLGPLPRWRRADSLARRQRTDPRRLEGNGRPGIPW